MFSLLLKIMGKTIINIKDKRSTEEIFFTQEDPDIEILGDGVVHVDGEQVLRSKEFKKQLVDCAKVKL